MHCESAICSPILQVERLAPDQVLKLGYGMVVVTSRKLKSEGLEGHKEWYHALSYILNLWLMFQCFIYCSCLSLLVHWPGGILHLVIVAGTTNGRAATRGVFGILHQLHLGLRYARN
jgi:hypothetical protein